MRARPVISGCPTLRAPGSGLCAEPEGAATRRSFFFGSRKLTLRGSELQLRQKNRCAAISFRGDLSASFHFRQSLRGVEKSQNLLLGAKAPSEGACVMSELKLRPPKNQSHRNLPMERVAKPLRWA